VIAFTHVLFVNGQATDQTVGAARRLGRALGLRAKIIPRWGELELQAEDEDAELSCKLLDMDRVNSTMWRSRMSRPAG
jgi:hypothetical protein